MQTENFIEYLLTLGKAYLPKLAMAIITLIIGLWIISLIVKGTKRLMQKRNLDDALRKFLSSVLNIALKAALIISILSMAGVAVTSFVALLGAAGLAIGMALSGTLQNFAGGVMILLLKPFKVGQFIQAQGYSGTVQEIAIFHTIITTPDNKRVILPNAPLSTGAVVNFSAEPTRRVDMTFGIGYADNIDQAKDLLMGLVQGDTRVLKDPEPLVAVAELADSSVNFTVRAWVKGADYFPVLFDMTEQVKKTFDANQVSIPFPQQDVHVHQAQ